MPVKNCYRYRPNPDCDCDQGLMLQKTMKHFNIQGDFT